MLRRRGAFAAVNTRIILVGAAIALCVSVLVFAWQVRSRVLHDSELVVLVPHAEAEWIRFAEPTSLRVRTLGDYQTHFRLRFEVDSLPADAMLRFKILRAASIYLNDDLVVDTREDGGLWKELRSVSLAQNLQAGQNDLRVEVHNHNGPRALIAWCPPLSISTDAGWEASIDGEEWFTAALASERTPPELAAEFSTTKDAFVRILPFLIPLFIVVFVCGSLPLEVWPKVLTDIRPGHVRWLLIFAWVVLAVNNIKKIEPIIGFDIEGHINYIRIVADLGRLPLANEGWQAFQSPFYYIVSAPLYRLFSRFYDLDVVIQLLRVIPLLCGVLQVEIAYRTMRLLFADRKNLQVVGTLIGALLPINLYISQTIGNEPLCGVFTALTFYLALRLNRSGAEERRLYQYSILGLVLGLAILTKVSALLMIPPVFVALFAVAYREGLGERAGHVKGMAVAVASCAIVSGWYFVRNWVVFGKPFVGGWDPAREIVWWQDPGYRVLEHFTSFGAALHRPIASGVQGMWDAFYSSLWLDSILSGMVVFEFRPPWNYDFAIAGAWLGLLPTVAIFVGIVVMAFRPRWAVESGIYLAPMCIAIYLAAFAYLFLSLPIYSTGKATYTVGLTPCYAALAALGIGQFVRWSYVRGALYGGLACWAASSYAAYFVI